MKATRGVTIFLAMIGLAAVVLLKTISWPMNEIIPAIENVNEVLVVETLSTYPNSRQAYLNEQQIADLLSVMTTMELQFEKKSDTFVHEDNAPTYDLFLSGADEYSGVIFVSGTKFHHDNTLYTITEEDAAAINAVFASCFS